MDIPINNTDYKHVISSLYPNTVRKLAPSNFAAKKMRKNINNRVLIILISSFSLFYFQTILAFDNDPIPDELDNCTDIPNIEQRDSDSDGFGNRCDGDLNNDCNVNFQDLSIFRSYVYSSKLSGDLNGDGNIDYLDLLLLSNVFSDIPGPSGISDCVLTP